MAKKLFYQLYPISWIGQGSKSAFKNMTDFLPHLHKLQVDYIWLSPIYKSQWLDGGYDVSSYYLVDSRLGTVEEFCDFVEIAHAFGIKVLTDIVINHISVNSDVFDTKPSWFYLSDSPKNGWRNLFDSVSSSWDYSKRYDSYYCHLFASNQADIKWFNDDGSINEEIVGYYKRVCQWLIHEYHVDGFRIDAPQAINKSIDDEVVDFGTLIGTGSKTDRSIQVINAIFCDIPCMLISEIFDPMNIGLATKYCDNTPIQGTMDLLLRGRTKDELESTIPYRGEIVYLESHDTNRCLNRFDISLDEEIELLFKDNPSMICLYQGQEFGTKNPTRREITLFERLDAEFALQRKSQNVGEIIETARANNRVAVFDYLPNSGYYESYSAHMYDAIAKWKEKDWG